MNYFQLFEIPVQLKINKDSIKKKYFELSKKYHPDYFVSAPPSEQQNALEIAALLNKGLKTLGNTEDTIAYVLKLKGLLEEEEKYQLPPAFLMEMMEINEEVAAANIDNNPNKRVQLFQQLTQLDNNIYEPVKEIIENYKDGVTTTQELLQVKDYYFKKKYLHRLYQQLK